MSDVGAHIIAETTMLADAIRRAPHARVRKYPSWDLTDLGRHVGEIHGWVTGIVRSCASERPSRDKLAQVAAEDVPGVLHVGAVALAEVLDNCDPTDPVWSFTGMTTNEFWSRRMINETTIHRWDAQDAIGSVASVPVEVARDGIDEALTTYISGSAAEAGWTVSVDDLSIVVTNDADGGQARISGEALDLWLLAMGRRRLKGLEIAGDDTLAVSFAEHTHSVRGPAG